MMKKEEIFRFTRDGNKDVINAYINADNVNMQDEDGITLLHVVSARNYVELCRALISIGAKLSIQDRNGQTPLHYCALNQCLDVAYEILSEFPPLDVVDNYGNQALWSAVIKCPQNDIGLVKRMICQGADANWKNNVGKSPLDLAVEMEDDELIRILKK